MNHWWLTDTPNGIAWAATQGSLSFPKAAPREAWLCPSCQRVNGPHVDTCPCSED